jgi:hypothetical protein
MKHRIQNEVDRALQRWPVLSPTLRQFDNAEVGAQRWRVESGLTFEARYFHDLPKDRHLSVLKSLGNKESRQSCLQYSSSPLRAPTGWSEDISRILQVLDLS